MISLFIIYYYILYLGCKNTDFIGKNHIFSLFFLEVLKNIRNFEKDYA